MEKKQKILICVLDWGLGHATRCVPVINYLGKNNIEVVVAGSGDSLQLLKNEFPLLTHLELPSYDIRYGKGPSQVWAMIKQSGKINSVIKEENAIVNRWINEYAIDKIISDNRYGCYSDKVPSVIITHQTGLLLPGWLNFFESISHHWISKRIANFNECWIPDVEGENNLSGKLSHHFSTPVKTKFIGPLTRFSYEKNLAKQYDVLAVLSGPEPQRSLLEEKLLEQFKLFPDKKIILVAGKINGQYKSGNNIDYIPYAETKKLNDLISCSDIIISRSGYSTIMDLCRSNKKVILVPTPGQTEQEYLAKYLSLKNLCVIQSQQNLNLTKAFIELERVKPFDVDIETNSLKYLEEFLAF